VKIDITLEAAIMRTPRVVQVSGMFDMATEEKSRMVIAGELPIEDLDWNVGLIVGPSGSGKSSVARALFGADLVTAFDWPADQSVLDGFPPTAGIKEVTGLLTAVGFGSPPAWLRPFHTLSNGEQFRVTMARGLAETSDLLVVDEFTSVVDRQVAKIASHSVQKAVRRAKRRLIAISCHYDVIPWIQPDWIYEPHLGAFEARSVQRRPDIAFEIRSVGREIWPIFAPHHYLSSRLSPGALCVGGFVEGRCVAFSAAAKFPHPTARNIFAEHRTVVLPDNQGLGLSRALTEWLGQHLWERGWRFHAVTSHPAIIAQKAASPRWRLMRHGTQSPGGRRADPGFKKHQGKFSATRVSAAFAYIAPAGSPSTQRPERVGALFENRRAPTGGAKGGATAL